MHDEFWKHRSLAELSDAQWEALCDGCGRCCLYKLEDADRGTIDYTRVACRLLDLYRCRCTRYAERARLMPTCRDLRRDFDGWAWLPATCAYRLLREGKDLPHWHPLRTGSAESVHEAGVSVRHFAISETQTRRLEDHILRRRD